MSFTQNNTERDQQQQAIGLLFEAKHKLFEASGAIKQLGHPEYGAEFKAVAEEISRFLLDWSNRA